MASTTTNTTTHDAGKIKLAAAHDFRTLIGYTRPPADGSEPSMDALASEHTLYRDVRNANVYDVRGLEDKFNLEEHGFQYFKLPRIPGERVVNFKNESDPKILGIYYTEMAEWFAKEYVIEVFGLMGPC